MPATAPQMNEHLAQFYGTKQASAATDEEAEKQASVELFLKVASDQNIDLNSMSDADVQALYGEFQTEVAKIASEEEPKEEKDEEEEKKEKEEKHAAAAAEWAEKQAMAADIQKADYLGRVMAHSFEQERGYIKEAGAAEALKKLTGKRPHMAAHDAGEAVRHGAQAVRRGGRRVADKAGMGPRATSASTSAEKAERSVGTQTLKPGHAKCGRRRRRRRGRRQRRPVQQLLLFTTTRSTHRCSTSSVRSARSRWWFRTAPSMPRRRAARSPRFSSSVSSVRARRSLRPPTTRSVSTFALSRSSKPRATPSPGTTRQPEEKGDGRS